MKTKECEILHYCDDQGGGQAFCSNCKWNVTGKIRYDTKECPHCKAIIRKEILNKYEYAGQDYFPF